MIKLWHGVLICGTRQLLGIALLAALVGCGGESEQSGASDSIAPPAAASTSAPTASGASASTSAPTAFSTSSSSSVPAAATEKPLTPLAGNATSAVISSSSGASSTHGQGAVVGVQQTSARALTVSWTAPTENTDGSALTNLVGYKIYYGTSKSNLINEIDVDTVGIQTYVVEDLNPGVWYFAVSAYNSIAIESEPSNIAEGSI